MKSNNKPKIAFFDFTGCEGCQLTVIDALQSYPELLDAVEIVQFREAMSEKGESYEIAFIEGSFTRKSDAHRLKKIRAQAQIVVALGACAHLGGINSQRNTRSLKDLQRYVYADQAHLFEADQGLPIASCIEVDAFIPGCPIDQHEFICAVRSLLQGNLPNIPDHPLCVECKMKENECTFMYGVSCLGPIIRAGCGAICPTFGIGCKGCRGLIPNANIQSLREVMKEHTDKTVINAQLAFFISHQIRETEMVEHVG